MTDLEIVQLREKLDDCAAEAALIAAAMRGLHDCREDEDAEYAISVLASKLRDKLNEMSEGLAPREP